MEGLLLILLGAIMYFVPSIVSDIREHRNKSAIITLNILLGWTVIGWVWAFVWAMTADTDDGVAEN